jgi:hypothetical protein
MKKIVWLETAERLKQGANPSLRSDPLWVNAFEHHGVL